MSGGGEWQNMPPGNEPPRPTNNSNNPYLHHQPEQNPWSTEESANPIQYSTPSHQNYAPPPGPPPGQQDPQTQDLLTGSAWGDQQSRHQTQQPHHNTNQPGLPPRRSATFEEEQFIPESERGEQREALEQFEMNKGGESQEDRDVATLQQEFPGVDGSLVAALYGDSKSLSGTREMLRELGGS
ncbi:hypothetical protein LTR62_007932 [Meristemomyces frigidus]|uniref:CUE domain-containing protein n=1 Tax=Meristemomyces frigidus TaxID=1508187 RepID=A0AAN7TPC7_9PEZI|nr:hypothetical protein LTR62_007932 [Meristemomyces frigidus]